MTPERWRRVQELFAAAVERRGPERQAYLADACADDESMRQEVESLLAAHAQAGDFIDTPAFRFSPDRAAEPVPTAALAAAGPGRRFGPYEVIALLGAGGMGEVYRARDPRLGREVAIKVLPREAVEDQNHLRRFEHEARAVGALNHPNILAVYDVGREGAEPYVVTELLEGETLLARLTSGPLPPREALVFARQIAAGLAAAHDKGIVHRDLKPGNLFITEDGRLKILDFGLAKRQAPGGAGAAVTASGHTQPGLILGTAGYMSPEQVRGQQVDRRSDVFSFGAVLYEMLAGRRAFSGGSAVETMSAVLSQEPPPLASLGLSVPPAADALVRRCLRKDPGARFQSGRELEAALAALERDLGRGGGAETAAPGRARHTVAVLPFVNLSGDPEEEYFAEGMAEELTNALGHLDELRVLARLSTAQLRGRGADLQTLGERHGVDKVIEGSVRRAGNRLRITVQLVNLADGLHLWSEKYDREMSDVFALQDEIAQRVIGALRLRLAGSGPLRRRPTDDLEAYHLYLRGRYHWNKRHEGGLQESLRCFQQAIELDPAYALAWAGVADSYAVMGVSVFDVLPPREAMPRAKAAAQRALEIDDTLADAYACLGWVALCYDWDWAAAHRHFERALELDPERASTHHWYGFVFSAQGRAEEALATARRAFALDPLSLIINSQLGQALYYGRRFDEAMAEMRKVLAMEPGFAIAHFWLGSAQAAKGLYREAIESFRAYSDLVGSGTRGAAMVAHAQAQAGDREAAQRGLEELRQLARRRYVPAFHRALVHLGLEDFGAALAALEQACEERCDGLAFLAVDTLFDPLRSQPRFQALMRRVGLETAAEAAGAPGEPHGERPKAIAVLPFRDLARDPANQHLGLGLADATITELAVLKSLVVRPTSAILRYQHAPVDPVRAARELGVSAVLDGAFQRAGSRLRVTVQLLSGEDGQPLWASKIDTSLEDLFGMQDEVSRSVAQALEIQLSPRERRQLQRPRAARAPAAEAYELYLKGRVHLFLESLEECLLAVDCFDQACAADPEFALGWAGLADAYARIAFTFLPEGDWYGRAWAACEKALELDPDLPEARYVRGGRLRWSPQGGFDHAGALRDLVPAIAARPSLEEAHVRLGVILHHLGLIDEVERELEQALVISPGHALAHQHQGLCLYTRRRFEEALAIYEEAARQAPVPWIHYRIALCQIQLGRRDEAARTVERLQRHAPGDVLAHPVLGLLAALRGDADEARRQTALTVERRRDFGHYHHAQFDLACIAAQLGDAAGAVGWLREAAANGFPCAPDFTGDPLLEPLRGDAGYQALLEELETERRGYAALYAELRAASRSGGAPASASGATTSAAREAEPAIALVVLPFRDRSAAPENEHLRLGLADALIAELSAVRGLRVRPTAAILRFLDSPADPGAAARELGGAHALAGDFERSAAGLSISGRLIAADTGEPWWSGEQAAPAGGLPRLIGDLARSVAKALHVEGSFERLDALLAERSPTAAAAAVSAPAPAEEVYELCLKGRVRLLRENLPDLVAAVDCFEKARETDPGFAPAWAGLADAYARLAFDHQPEGDWYRRARTMCDRALELDANLPEGRYVRARLLWSPEGGFDHAGALRELHAALAARPTLMEARLKLGSVLLHVGLIEEAVDQHLEILAQSPGDPATQGYLGLCRYAQGRYEEAAELSAAAARAVPYAWYSYQLALCELHLRRFGGAGEPAGHTHPIRGLRAALEGNAEEARREAERISRSLRPFGHYHHAQYDIGCIHALLGETEPAIEWLSAAARNGFPCAPQFAGDPWLQGLKGAPRFTALLAELEAERERYATLYGELRARSA